MNTVVAAAFSAGAYKNTCFYHVKVLAVILYHKNAVFVFYVCIHANNAFVKTTESTLSLHKTLSVFAQDILHIQPFLKTRRAVYL